MGIFDRFFAKKEVLTNCDWCGADFPGAGVESGGLVFCTPACVEAKDAPAKASERRDPTKSKKMSLEDARAAIGTARSELQHFKRVLDSAMDSELVAASPTIESEINQREFELWRSLDDIRQACVGAALDVAAYDAQRERSVVNSIEIRHASETNVGLGLGGIKLNRTNSVTADFAAGNIERMRDAISALDRALA